MEDQTNLDDITDVNALKAMAYDRFGMLDRIQADLQALHARISHLSNQPNEEQP